LFTGRWVPIDADRAKALIEVGLSDVPWQGLDVVQDGISLIVTRLFSPEVERALALMGNVERRSIYNLDGKETRGGPNEDIVSTVTRDGQSLVIYTTMPSGTRRSVWTIAEDRLRIDTSISMNTGVSNTVVLMLRREQPAAVKGFGSLFGAPAKTAGQGVAVNSAEKEVICGLTMQHVSPALDPKIIMESDRLGQRFVTPRRLVPAIRRIEPDVCAPALLRSSLGYRILDIGHRRRTRRRLSDFAPSPDFIAHRSSLIAHRPSPIAHRPSPIAHRSSSAYDTSCRSTYGRMPPLRYATSSSGVSMRTLAVNSLTTPSALVARTVTCPACVSVSPMPRMS
jgi:hypothetical protein